MYNMIKTLNILVLINSVYILVFVQRINAYMQ